jgi:hypothetical protein
MADPITSTIAKAIRDGIKTAVAANADLAALDPAVTCVAMGVADATDGATADRESYPAVVVWVRECGQEGYRSVLRDYPVDISAVTWSPEDRFAVNMALLCEVVGTYIRGAPSLSLATPYTFKSLYIPSAPEPIEEMRQGGVVYGQRWSGLVKTQTA